MAKILQKDSRKFELSPHSKTAHSLTVANMPAPKQDGMAMMPWKRWNLSRLTMFFDEL